MGMTTVPIPFEVVGATLTHGIGYCAENPAECLRVKNVKSKRDQTSRFENRTQTDLSYCRVLPNNKRVAPLARQTTRHNPLTPHSAPNLKHRAYLKQLAVRGR